MSATEHGAAAHRGGRPLSPHLQIYRLPLAATLSILHRITGVAMAGGAVAVVAWLMAAASGQGAFDAMNWLLTSWLGKLAMMGFSFALLYHLCNGIRHLIWDAGCGMEKADVETSNKVVIGAAALLTALTWLYGLMS